MLSSANDYAASASAQGGGYRRRARRAMTAPTRPREHVFALIQAHLADELDLEPNAIGEGTRFKEDLEADSLDLYTLVQELEDTYGVSMSDEQAAQILTVGQAVDFVLTHDGR
jgi:acyl carrier protein